MSFRIPAVLGLLVSMTVLALIPTPADGCAMAPRQNEQLRTESEEAVIVYDEQAKLEHFIRTARFTGTSSDFGFLVPTPSKPEISEVPATIYGLLADISKPRIVRQKKYKSSFGIGCGETTPTFAANVKADAGRPEPRANVVEQKRVGNLDVAVLQADDPKAIRDWLSKNGYNDRPELTEWLKAYTDGKWFISAYKIASDVKGPISTTTVKMTFPTDVPFYPYREPSDARTSSAPGGRLLKLSVLANRISTGTVGFNKNNLWSAKTSWAGMIPTDRMDEVFNAMKISVRPNEAWSFTEFEDTSYPRPGTDELYFSPAKDQTPVERPPIIVYDEIDTSTRDWFMFLCVVIAVVGSILFVFGKLLSRRL